MQLPKPNWVLTLNKVFGLFPVVFTWTESRLTGSFTRASIFLHYTASGDCLPEAGKNWFRPQKETMGPK